MMSSSEVFWPERVRRREKSTQRRRKVEKMMTKPMVLGEGMEEPEKAVSAESFPGRKRRDGRTRG
jgi:hypothetical protein